MRDRPLRCNRTGVASQSASGCGCGYGDRRCCGALRTRRGTPPWRQLRCRASTRPPMAATSGTPRGPFVDTSTGPLICQTARGGSIDPNPYVDPATDAVVLLWKSDDNALGVGHPTHIWGQPVTANGRALAAGTSPSLLL